MIPNQLESLFWDANLDDFNPAAYPDYTILRVLEYGDEEAVVWMRGMFSAAEIRRVLCTERRPTRKSANFWALVYGIPTGQVAALAERPDPFPTEV